MSSSDAGEVPVAQSARGKSRKRLRRPANWRRTLMKRHKISSNGSRPHVACSHNLEHWCKVRALSEGDLKKHHDSLYEQASKPAQDAYITQYIEMRPIQRRRGQSDSFERQYSANYFLMQYDGTKTRVCLESFCGVLCVAKRRVQRLSAHLNDTGAARPERRGGPRNHPGFATMREAIQKHIECFNRVPSHYGRMKTPNRKYLSAILSVRRMWSLFKDTHAGNDELSQCTYKQYWAVFVSDYNLGFGTPRTDTCSVCEAKIQQMKSCDAEKKKELAVELLAHKNEAKIFYHLLNKHRESSTAVFAVDMMQNQPLPKLAIGEAFYSRQIWQYVLGIVRHRGRDSSQAIEDCFIYTWTEHEAGKGSDEIASALVDFFRRFVQANPAITTVSIFSDSCAAQNKNYSLLLVLSALARELEVKFELNYPLPRHSFLPADRMFGRLEKILRRHDTLLTPEDYMPLFRRVASVRILGKDWFVYGFKTATRPFLRSQPGIRISRMKFIRIEGLGKISCSTKYGSVQRDCNLVKTKKDLNLFRFNRVPRSPTSRPLKKQKLQDVKTLLVKTGIDDRHPAWSFYRGIESLQLQGLSSAESASDSDT